VSGLDFGLIVWAALNASVIGLFAMYGKRREEWRRRAQLLRNQRALRERGRALRELRSGEAQGVATRGVLRGVPAARGRSRRPLLVARPRCLRKVRRTDRGRMRP
jgi:hypothetical protein